MIHVLVNFSFVKYVSSIGARDRAVGVATRLRAGRSGVRIPAAVGDLSLIHNIQTGFRPTQTLVQWIKGKAIPLQASTGPEDSRRLRLPEIVKFST